MLLTRSPKVDDGDELDGVRGEIGSGSRCWSWLWSDGSMPRSGARGGSALDIEKLKGNLVLRLPLNTSKGLQIYPNLTAGTSGTTSWTSYRSHLTTKGMVSQCGCCSST